jgi:hypothetical protein
MQMRFCRIARIADLTKKISGPTIIEVLINAFDPAQFSYAMLPA